MVRESLLRIAAAVTLGLGLATPAFADISLFDRITPPSGPANSLVNGGNPIAAISVQPSSPSGYVGTIEFSTPAQALNLSQIRVAYGGLTGSDPSTWTLRFMVWSSFETAINGLPGSTTNMYNGDVATIDVLGSQATFAPFGTHFFGGPIYDATVNLAPYNIALDPNRNYVIGFTVFNAGDVGVMETSQLGAPDRGLSPFYSGTGWRFLNTFEGLDVGRYAVALHGTPVPGPGAAGLFGVAALVGLRRRRR